MAVQILARAPRPGATKTRLIPALGAARAARLQRALTASVAAVACEAAVGPVTLWCTPDPGHPSFCELRSRLGVALRAQGEGDLGRRMEQALAAGVADAGRAVVIGSDLADLTAADLREAASVLGLGRDAVIGPAADGGYYLIGARQVRSVLFEGIAWGSDGVLAATRARLRILGWSWEELAVRRDVDRPEDLLWVEDTLLD